MQRRDFLKYLSVLAGAVAIPSGLLFTQEEQKIGSWQGIRFYEQPMTTDVLVKAKALLKKHRAKPFRDGNYRVLVPSAYRREAAILRRRYG